MALGMIHRLIDVMLGVSQILRIKSSCADMEQTSVMVHRIMSFQARQFHTLEHVFGFIEEDSDPHTILAAVFHDLIYYQVDDGIQPVVNDLVQSIVESADDGLHLRIDLPQSDKLFHLCRRVFGFESGRLRLPFTGLNEFLSALIFARLLGGQLAELDVLAVIVCIEASIPFRGRNPEGRTMGEQLEFRLESLRSDKVIDCGSEEVQLMVKRAIAFANADVRDFALSDAGRFLNNTWKLLPELNSSLRLAGTFTIFEYRLALGKMLGFFRSLLPENIFHDYRGYPDLKAFRKLIEGARRNLAVAEAYMQAKIMAITLLEAIAMVSGGDAPVALFMGDLPDQDDKADSLDLYLPKIETPTWMDTRSALYHLLKTGRMDTSAFDLKNSPLAFHLYCRLPPEAWLRLETRSAEFCSSTIDAETYLLAWPAEVRNDVIRACRQMVQTRRDEFDAWMLAHS